MDEVHKKEDGLSLSQRRVMAQIIAGSTIKEACEAENVSIRTFTGWMAQPAFKRAYDDVFSEEYLDNLKKTLQGAAASAVEIYEDAMANANRSIKVDCACPKCGNKFNKWVRVEDWKARLHAADTLLKISNILTTNVNVKGNIDHNVQLALPHDLQVALMAHRAGRPIPPAMEQKLIEMGRIQQKQLTSGEDSGTVEGQYRVVEETSEDSNTPE